MWTWILIIIALVLIFNANDLPQWKEKSLQKIEYLKQQAKEKKAEIEQKIKEEKEKNKKD